MDNNYYYHQDEQGSTAIITGENADIKNSYRYDAFGKIIESQEELPNRITYTGQQYDPLTQQYYLRARYYNPIIGRFTQEDTYRGDGLNLYAYCSNNPVSYYDPTGYAKEASPPCKAPAVTDADGGDTKRSVKSGTVWDNIKATQPVYEGTSIPKSFNIKVGNQEFWVNPNGTKHMLEYVGSNGKNISTFTSSVSSQEMVTSFESAFAEAIKKNGVVTDTMIRGGDWEFILSAPREAGLNVVVKHARYNP